MKKHIVYIFLLLFSTSCEKVLMEEEIVDDPVTNFENLWQTADEKYSFFEYKDINWDDVYQVYRPQISNSMSQFELFDILKEMLNELRDGHVNLIAPFDVSRYQFKFFAPENFNLRLLKDNYIGWDYRTAGPLLYSAFQREDKVIGYIYYESFSGFVENADIDFVIAVLKTMDGIILDMRSNGGGSVSNIYKIGSRLADKRRFIYSSAMKNGPGHEDFGDAVKVYMEPTGSLQYTGKVILLTNRGCYSATSFFALAMKAFPHVIQVGDTTGGGLGAPAGFELPNGWGYRFSVSRTFSPDGQNFENGVPPDHTVWMDPQNEIAGVDDIMEKAIDLIVDDQ